jgi:TolB-like protein
MAVREPDLSLNAPRPEAVRRQMLRIRESAEFSSSMRLLAFLQFVVEETLTNGGRSIKEVVIGNAIYERDPPYDTRIDSTVRVEARRLRRKLREYYGGSGNSDPVLIELPTGGYVPTFSQRIVEPAALPVADESRQIFRAGDGAAIAIMPLRPIPNDVELATFADGLTDELIYTLGKADGLRITSRGIVFQYKGQERSPADLAGLLGVNAVLQGTVRRDHELLRVTIEVADVDGFVVWSDRFDAPADRGMGLQEKIAKTLLSRARFDSSKMRDQKIAPGPNALRANAQIYRARLLLDQQTPEGIAAARRLFQQVAEAAPDYSRGHSGLADCYCDLFRLGIISRDEALAKAVPAAQAALAIDEESLEANAATATILAWLERDPPAAESAYEYVRELGGNARTNRLFGVFLSLFGEHEKAQGLFREARELEPFSIQQDIAEAISHYQARRFGMLSNCAARNGGISLPGEAQIFSALAHQFAGVACDVDSIVSSIDQQCGNTPELRLAAREIEAWAGRRHRAERLTAQDLGKATHFARATLALSLGNSDMALSQLREALTCGELSTAWMRSDPRFDSLRPHPVFQELLTQLKPLRPVQLREPS